MRNSARRARSVGTPRTSKAREPTQPSLQLTGLHHADEPCSKSVAVRRLPRDAAWTPPSVSSSSRCSKCLTTGASSRHPGSRVPRWRTTCPSPATLGCERRCGWSAIAASRRRSTGWRRRHRPHVGLVMGMESQRRHPRGGDIRAGLADRHAPVAGHDPRSNCVSRRVPCRRRADDGQRPARASIRRRRARPLPRAASAPPTPSSSTRPRANQPPSTRIPTATRLAPRRDAPRWSAPRRTRTRRRGPPHCQGQASATVTSTGTATTTGDLGQRMGQAVARSAVADLRQPGEVLSGRRRCSSVRPGRLHGPSLAARRAGTRWIAAAPSCGAASTRLDLPDGCAPDRPPGRGAGGTPPARRSGHAARPGGERVRRRSRGATASTRAGSSSTPTSWTMTAHGRPAQVGTNVTTRSSRAGVHDGAAAEPRYALRCGSRYPTPGRIAERGTARARSRPALAQLHHDRSASRGTPGRRLAARSTATSHSTAS